MSKKNNIVLIYGKKCIFVGYFGKYVKDALQKLEEVLDPIKVVEFEPDFDLTKH